MAKLAMRCNMRALLIIAILLFALAANADGIKVTVIGEALIVNNDLSSAKIQAEQRARWAAMEEAAQVKVTAESVVHNSILLDETIKSEVTGAISEFKKLDEGKDGNTYWIQAEVTVKPDDAKNLMANISKNTTIAVYIPLFTDSGEVEETHSFSEQLIAELINKGLDVVDLASGAESDLRNAILAAAQKRDIAEVRRFASQFMAGSVLIGKLQVVDKGSDIGYAKVNFSIVDGEIDYRLIGDKNGTRAIITSGVISGRGQGATPKAAAYAVSKNMAAKNSLQLAGTIASKILGESKRSVRVVLIGNNDLNKYNAFKNTVKNISWVLDVRETGLDSVVVSYPEKTMYLAAIINNNGGYTVKSFTDTEVLVYPK
jgi:hypothetical protein